MGLTGNPGMPHLGDCYQGPSLPVQTQHWLPSPHRFLRSIPSLPLQGTFHFADSTSRAVCPIAGWPGEHVSAFLDDSLYGSSTRAMGVRGLLPVFLWSRSLWSRFKIYWFCSLTVFFSTASRRQQLLLPLDLGKVVSNPGDKEREFRYVGENLCVPDDWTVS